MRASTTYALDRGEDGFAHNWRVPYFADTDPEAGIITIATRPASVYVNPPYSDPLPWCMRLAEHTGPWVTLVKLDPTTGWWRALMEGAHWWAPFRRRIKFLNADGRAESSARFPTALMGGGGWWPDTHMANYEEWLWPTIKLRP